MNTKTLALRVTRHAGAAAAKAAMLLTTMLGGGNVGVAFAQSPRQALPSDSTPASEIRFHLKGPSLRGTRPPRAGDTHHARANAHAFRVGKPLIHLDMLVRARAFEPEITRAADRYGIDPRLLWCVAFNETRFAPRDAHGRPRVSRKGAAGLMQFMPGTAARFRINPLDDRQAIHGAALYLRMLLDRYRGDTRAALAAYNAGEGAVDAYRYGITVNRSGAAPINHARLHTSDGLPPFRETRNYVRQAQTLWHSMDWGARFEPAQLARTATTFGGGMVITGVSGTAALPATGIAVTSAALAEVRPATDEAAIRRTMFQLPLAVHSFEVPQSVVAGRAGGSVHHGDEENAVSSTPHNNSVGGEMTARTVSQSDALPRATTAKPHEKGEVGAYSELFSSERFIVHAPRTTEQPRSRVLQNGAPWDAMFNP